MSGTYLGKAVVSVAGRDRGRVCLVVREEEEFLWIADGRKHPVESPKRKRRKHIRLLTDEARFDGTPTDRVVRTWLRETANRVQTEK